MPAKLNAIDFVSKANETHNGRYTYDFVEYIDYTTPININCTHHGLFLQTPRDHLAGKGCRLCAKNYKKSTDHFVSDAINLHGDRYDYSKVDYVSAKVEVCIICKEHGEFMQTPNSHLLGHGCTKCAGCDKKNTKWFIDKAENIHGKKYNYGVVDYIGMGKPVTIICPEHGEFKQTPYSHLSGSGCNSCANYGYSRDLSKLFYILDCSDFVGFGITKDFKTRLKSHSAILRKHGLTITKYVIIPTESGEAAKVIEKEIMREFSKNRHNSGIAGFKREALKNISFKQLHDYVSTIQGV